MSVPKRFLSSQQVGLGLVIAALSLVLSLFAGSHFDVETGDAVNNFLNSRGRSAAGMSAFMGASFYGSASCADATGYSY